MLVFLFELDTAIFFPLSTSDVQPIYSILPQHVIFLQAIEQLKPHMNSRVIQSEGDMEDIYTLIPFPDKERSFFYKYQFKLVLKSTPVSRFFFF